MDERPRNRPKKELAELAPLTASLLAAMLSADLLCALGLFASELGIDRTENESRT